MEELVKITPPVQKMKISDVLIQMDGKMPQTIGCLCKEVEGKDAFCAIGMLAFEKGARPTEGEATYGKHLVLNGIPLTTHSILRFYGIDNPHNAKVTMPQGGIFNIRDAIISLNDMYKWTPKQIGEYLAAQGY